LKDFKLKITGGKLKSRLLSFDKNNLIRPTKSYIRELIFNVVKINKKTKCLDLFAGSAILSAEAYSRGASCIDMVEISPNTCNMIKSEFEKLEIENYKIYNDKVDNYLSININRDYDLIFIDPPYKTNMLEDTLFKLQSLEYLSNAEYLYFEQQKDVNNSRCVNLINNDFEVVKSLSIGDVSYTIAKKR